MLLSQDHNSLRLSKQNRLEEPSVCVSVFDNHFMRGLIVSYNLFNWQ